MAKLLAFDISGWMRRFSSRVMERTTLLRTL
jgi:hypothetical protein